MTSFKERVYKIVKRILRGKTMTYQQVAKIAGKPKAWRAVGNILNKNRDLYPPKFSKKTLAGEEIPCHRVIKSNGRVRGHNRGIENKIALLKSEGVKIKNKKVIF